MHVILNGTYPTYIWSEEVRRVLFPQWTRLVNNDFNNVNLCAGAHAVDTMASTTPSLATPKQAVTALLTEHFRYTPLVRRTLPPPSTAPPVLTGL